VSIRSGNFSQRVSGRGPTRPSMRQLNRPEIVECEGHPTILAVRCRKVARLPAGAMAHGGHLDIARQLGTKEPLT
jgi:hypothetical protein